MALVTTTEMFKKAYDGGYAIGAFNVNNMEIVQAITEACKEEKSPVILQVSKGARAYANHTYLVKLVEAAILECPEASEKIENGDSVSVDFDTGIITNITKNESYQAEPFPDFVKEIIKADGLMNSIRKQ